MVAPQAWALAQVGRVLSGRWTLVRCIGLGGSAAVFEAVHRNGKPVAIKLLRPDRAQDARARRRFLREGYAANRVGHPRVVTVDDDGEEPDGTAFLVMELMRGESVDRLAERHGGRLPWAFVVQLTAELLEVLEAAHEKGIIHRDIKPANLFHAEEGGLRVLDFGLARCSVLSGDLGETQDGALLGTPAFMAPEQARAVDTGGIAGDLWAVGATAFTLLAGRTVHEADSVDELLALAATASAPSLRVHVPDVPAAVAQVLQTALAYERDQRWPSASLMRRALLSALEGPESLASPLGLAATTLVESGHGEQGAVVVTASRTTRAASGKWMMVLAALVSAGVGVLAGARWVAGASVVEGAPRERSSSTLEGPREASVVTPRVTDAQPTSSPKPALADSSSPPATASAADRATGRAARAPSRPPSPARTAPRAPALPSASAGAAQRARVDLIEEPPF
jgi:serine/threonine-protein kinase